MTVILASGRAGVELKARRAAACAVMREIVGRSIAFLLCECVASVRYT